MKRKTNFDRSGLTLVGNLFTPENFDENGHYKAVIVEGSFTSVKEQMRLCPEVRGPGFVALAFDYSHYGESAGEPRQLESAVRCQDSNCAGRMSQLLRGVLYLSEDVYILRTGQSKASVRKMPSSLGQNTLPHRGPSLDLRRSILDRPFEGIGTCCAVCPRR